MAKVETETILDLLIIHPRGFEHFAVDVIPPLAIPLPPAASIPQVFRGFSKAGMKYLNAEKDISVHPPGERIGRTSEISILLRGRARMYRVHPDDEFAGPNSVQLATLGPGACWGELSLLGFDVPVWTVRAQSFCVVATFTRRHLAVLARDFQDDDVKISAAREARADRIRLINFLMETQEDFKAARPT